MENQRIETCSGLVFVLDFNMPGYPDGVVYVEDWPGMPFLTLHEVHDLARQTKDEDKYA